jgi:hypothetical protein
MIAVRSKSLISCALVTIVTLALGANLRADSVAVTIVPDPNNTFNNFPPSYSFGYEFLANSDMTVTQLGYFADTELTETHVVGIYTASGTLLASTTVTNADSLTDFFRYSAIAPLVLTAGQEYVIAGTSGVIDPYAFTPTSFSFDPSLTFVTDLFDESSSLIFPTSSSGVVGYFGPNFQFTSAVPEPSTLLLGSIAAIGGLVLSCRRSLSNPA